MAVSGADVERLRELAKKFTTEAGNLNTLITHLKNASDGSHDFWTGGDADKFRTEWAQLKPTFDNFVKTLHSAHDWANNSADRVERATSAH